MKTFEWSRIGDVAKGRENLGTDMPVEIYRLMQYTVTDVLTEALGAEKAEEILRAAGYQAGMAFSQRYLSKEGDFNAFVADLQQQMKQQRIGILRVEKADLDKLELMLTVSEDLDCSGLPLQGDTVCVYDEGFIEAILFDYTGKTFTVREIDCWATGDRTCRFSASALA